MALRYPNNDSISFLLAMEDLSLPSDCIKNMRTSVEEECEKG